MLSTIFLLPVTAIINVSVTSLDFTVIAGTPIMKSITVNNTNNYTIYNIALTPTSDVTFSNITKLLSGGTATLNFTVLSNTNYDRTLTPKIVYTYQENVTISPTISTVVVNNNGFTPSTKSVIVGSTIIFLNNGSENHTVTSTSFDNSLTPNSNVSKTFSSVGIVEYYDKVTNFGGSINVLSEQDIAQVHNSAQDTTINLHIISQVLDSSINNSFLDISMPLIIKTGGTRQVIMKIVNTGSKIVQNVSLIGTWAVFSEQNFNVDVGVTKYLPLSITPVINNINDSGKTYDYNYTINTYNSGQYTIPISINVPTTTIEEINSSTNSGLNWLLQRKQYCDAHPFDVIVGCYQEERTITQNVTIYKSVPVSVNMTQEEFLSCYNTLQKKTDSDERLNNYVKERFEVVVESTETSKNLSSATRNDVELLREKTEFLSSRMSNNRIILWVLIILNIIGIGGWIGYQKISKSLKKNKVYGGETI